MTPDQLRNVKPLPGRCVIEFDPFPEKIGSLFIPETAKEQDPLQDPMWPATVLAMTPRRDPKTGEPRQEQFQVGDRVLLALRGQDLNQQLVATHNTRVWCKLEEDQF